MTLSEPNTPRGLALLLRVVGSAQTPDEMEGVLTTVWTPGEMRDAAQRVEVAAQLMEGCTYEVIAHHTGASTATISRVRRSLERGAGMLEKALLRVGRADAQYSHRSWASGGGSD